MQPQPVEAQQVGTNPLLEHDNEIHQNSPISDTDDDDSNEEDIFESSQVHLYVFALITN